MALIKMLSIVIICSVITMAKDYFTYANRTFFVMRESEMGFRDTVRVDSITSMTRHGSTVELRNGKTVVYTVTEPKERIIGAQGE